MDDDVPAAGSSDPALAPVAEAFARVLVRNGWHWRSLGWWSREGRYAIGFVTGYVADHDRVSRLDNAVRGCLALPPL
jgi:hypothetical protein